MRKNILIVLAILSFDVSAQPRSLSSLLDSITSVHPSQRMYEADIRAMDAAAEGARSWMPPEFGAGLFMTPYNPQMWKRMGMERGMGSFMISGQQMIPNAKALRANETYMRAMSSSEKQRKQATLNDLFAEAKKLYYESIILQKKLVLLKENEKLLDFMIRTAEIRYKNGLEKIGAYYKAKASLGNSQRMRVMQENEIQLRRYQLNILLNRLPDQPLELDTSFMLKDFSTSPIDSSVIRNRSDIQALEQEIRTNTLRQEVEQQNLRPQFGVRYDHMVGFGGQGQLFTMMGMLKVPLASWSARMNKATIQSLNYRNQAIASQQQMMINDMLSMAYSMRSEFDTQKRQLQLYESMIIPALRNNYRTMLLGYEQNTEELFMLFDAWESLNMTQQEYLDQLQKALQLQTTIEQILQIR